MSLGQETLQRFLIGAAIFILPPIAFLQFVEQLRKSGKEPYTGGAYLRVAQSVFLQQESLQPSHGDGVEARMTDGQNLLTEQERIGPTLWTRLDSRFRKK